MDIHSNSNNNGASRKTFDVFLRMLRKEISIRSSLILFYILLISFVSITIIVVNHQILNRVLVSLTERIMEDTGDIVQRQIDDYLEPFTYDLIEAVNLITEKVIVPAPDYKFTRYLIERVRPDPQVYSAYWASPNGDFFGLKREPNNMYQIWRFEVSNAKPVRIYSGVVNGQGRLVSLTPAPLESFDPRTRPWFRLAVENQTTIWTNIYKFELFRAQGFFPDGITAARAVYDENKKLVGVFGMDITLDQLADFIRKIQVSNNNIILVTDKYNSLIAAQGNAKLEQLIGKKITPTSLKQLDLPFLTSFFYKEVIYGKVF